MWGSKSRSSYVCDGDVIIKKVSQGEMVCKESYGSAFCDLDVGSEVGSVFKECGEGFKCVEGYSFCLKDDEEVEEVEDIDEGISSPSGGSGLECEYPYTGGSSCSCKLSSLQCQYGDVCSDDGVCIDEGDVCEVDVSIESSMGGRSAEVYVDNDFFELIGSGLDTRFTTVKECDTDEDIEVKCAQKKRSCLLDYDEIEYDVSKSMYIRADCTVCEDSFDVRVGKVVADVEENMIQVEVIQNGFDAEKVDILVRVENADLTDEFTYNDNVRLSKESQEIEIPLGSKKLRQGSYVHVYVDSKERLEEYVVETKESLEDNNYKFKVASRRPLVENVNFRGLGEFEELEQEFETIIKEEFNVQRSHDPSTDIILTIKIDSSLNQQFKVSSSRVWSYGSGTYDYFVEVEASDIVHLTAGMNKLISNKHSLFIENSGFVDSTKEFRYTVDDEHYIKAYDIFTQGETVLIGNIEDSKELAQQARKLIFDNTYTTTLHKIKTEDDTSYGESTYLRVKHLNSDFSNVYMQEVGLDSTPIVMSGGIFTNIDSFTPFGSELVEEGYDVWLIEMNGGPFTECDECPNSEFEDLAYHYFPTSIASVLGYTDEEKVHYIGHSNGGRTALFGLHKYSLTGLEEAGERFNYETGEWDENSLPKEFVDKFFGIGVPVTLNGDTAFTYLAREYGKSGVDNIKDMSHVKLKHYAQPIRTDFYRDLYLDIIATAKPELLNTAILSEIIVYFGVIFSSGDKLSQNVMMLYHELASENDTQVNLSDIKVNKLYMLMTNPGDLVVPYDDAQVVMNQTVLIDEEDKEVIPYNRKRVAEYMHIFQTNSIFTKKEVKKGLK